MTEYWAVMIDETGCEFGAGVTADNRAEAIDELHDRYPECRGIAQLESPEDIKKREARMYERIQREMEGDFSMTPPDEW